MNGPKPYFLFTHTPLHVGSGKSVGYVDQPIQRETHTRIPIIPGSSLKGVLADRWNETIIEKRMHDGKAIEYKKIRRNQEGEWLFGKESAENAGALLVGEARVLAFPVRSAKGCFAWITSPIVLARAVRDKVLKCGVNLKVFTPTSKDDQAPDKTIIAGDSVKFGDRKVLLEEYTFTAADDPKLKELEVEFGNLLKADPVWEQLPGRLVIVSDTIFSYFVQAACEIAQHVKIDDERGTASDGALFNQENVPAETLFYGVLSAQTIQHQDAISALAKLAILNGKLLQIGGGETTGHGWCTFVFTN